MNVTETLSQGLKREFKVVFAAQELLSRLEEQLADIKTKVDIKGFRRGKVPTAHLRRVYGRSVMADVVQNAVNEANTKIVEDNSLRLALEPKVMFPEDKDEVERALDARGDLAYTVAVEVLPQIEPGTFEDIELERLKVPVSDEEVAAALDRLIARNAVFQPKAEGAEAAQGDEVTIDFTGTIDGAPFEGGEGTDIKVVLGSGTFLPGFEEQLVGIKAGEERLVKATFPADYGAEALAGKAAEFRVTAKAIGAPEAVTVDDEYAKSRFGLDSLDALRGSIRKEMEGLVDKASRDKLKRRLLDTLDTRYAFDLPDGLVSQEFDNIWRQVEADQSRSGRTFADENTTEDAARAEYRKIAERRVKLGLVLAEVGTKANVQIGEDEMRAALIERVRGFPGQEKQIWEYYTKTPQAMAEIRVPLFEEKVVDHILALTKLHERTVTRDELFAEDEAAPAGAAAPLPGDAAPLPDAAAEAAPAPEAPQGEAAPPA